MTASDAGDLLSAGPGKVDVGKDSCSCGPTGNPSQEAGRVQHHAVGKVKRQL